MSDSIQSLPSDDIPLKPHEQKILDTIFHNDYNPMHRVLRECKTPIVASILFIILCHPIFNDIIKRVVPYTQSSDFALNVCKGAIIFIILYII